VLAAVEVLPADELARVEVARGRWPPGRAAAVEVARVGGRGRWRLVELPADELAGVEVAAVELLPADEVGAVEVLAAIVLAARRLGPVGDTADLDYGELKELSLVGAAAMAN
jgi:hypothetical protein